MIHHPEEEINDSEDAVFIYPRATTYIGLQKERVLRLPPPTTDPCTETYPPDLYPRIEPKAKQSYSLRVCQEVIPVRPLPLRIFNALSSDADGYAEDSPP